MVSKVRSLGKFTTAALVCVAGFTAGSLLTAQPAHADGCSFTQCIVDPQMDYCDNSSGNEWNCEMVGEICATVACESDSECGPHGGGYCQE